MSRRRRERAVERLVPIGTSPKTATPRGIRAEIRLSSDGVQLVCPLFQGERLICVFAGSAENVIWTLQSYGVGIGDIIGMKPEWRELWGKRKERPIRI